MTQENGNNVNVKVEDILVVAHMYLAEDENFRKGVMVAAKSRENAAKNSCDCAGEKKGEQDVSNKNGQTVSAK
tara:strand:- start:197 stop:415 length:219 start_codon:yes stop_codon:yes gene_type:complete